MARLSFQPLRTTLNFKLSHFYFQSMLNFKNEFYKPCKGGWAPGESVPSDWSLFIWPLKIEMNAFNTLGKQVMNFNIIIVVGYLGLFKFCPIASSWLALNFSSMKVICSFVCEYLNCFKRVIQYGSHIILLTDIDFRSFGSRQVLTSSLSAAHQTNAK